MSADQSKRLPRIGEMLVTKGLVTKEALNHALEVQASTKTKIGHVLCQLGYVTQQQIERCLTEDVIAPILIREMDALTDGAYSKNGETNIVFNRLLRTRLVTDNLLNGSEESSEVFVIKGEAVVTLAGQPSLPFEFSINPATSDIKFDQFHRGGLKIWLRRLLGGQAAQPNSDIA